MLANCRPFESGNPDCKREASRPEFPHSASKTRVQNPSGAGGTIGTGRVARAAPDGYTIILGHWQTHIINAATYALPFDMVKDFEPVSLVADCALPPSIHNVCSVGHEIWPREKQTPAALAAQQKAEIEKWWPIIKAANIKAE